MKVKSLLIGSLALAALMTAFAFIVAGWLPTGAELPTHWNAAGEVDGTMPALTALLVPAGLVVFLAGLFAILPRLEPLQDRLEASAPLFRVAWIATLALMVLVQLTIAGPAIGLAVGPALVLAGVGGLLVVVGNALPKSRPGFFVGIRTPWTIVDEDIWIATHRLGGKLMILAGLLLIAAAFLPLSPAAAMPVIVGAVLLSVVVPIVYSWRLWDRKKRRR